MAALALEAYIPIGHCDWEQLVALPPADQEPSAHCRQPSVLCVAPVTVALVPGSQFMSVHSVTAPPIEYVPCAQLTQPSALVDAPFKVAYWPAGHDIE